MSHRPRTASESGHRARSGGLSARIVAGLAVAGLVLIASGSAASSPGAEARTVAGEADIGVLFVDGVGAEHNCTASVIRSRTRDVVLTAAHCVNGTGLGIQFVPGYVQGSAPHGVWDVTAAYVDPRWVSSQDPQYDFAFLIVAAHHSGGRSVRLGDVVAGNRLGPAPRPGQELQVTTYANEPDADAISCTAVTYLHAGYPAFDCDGYAAGTSGAPWLTAEVVTPGHPVRQPVRHPAPREPVVSGVIGGLEQGGCIESTSYSSRFDSDTFTVFERAVAGRSPDTLPVSRDADC